MRMSKVKVTYYGLIRNVVDNQEEEYQLSDGAIIRELLQLLVERYGEGFRANILTPDWQLPPTAIMHLNGRDINEIDGLDTGLDDNSELSIIVIPHVIRGG